MFSLTYDCSFDGLLSLCDSSGLAAGFLLEPVTGLADLLHPVTFLKDRVRQRTQGESPHGMGFHDLIRKGDGDGNPVDGRDQGIPLYLGIRAVAARSFARIHQANLINNGILPLTFVNEVDYDRVDQMDEITLPDVRRKIASGEEILEMRNETKHETYAVRLPLTDRQRGMILSGGLINFIRSQG